MGQLRVIVHIGKTEGGAWKATLSSIDQSPDWGATIPFDSVTLTGQNVKMAAAAVRGNYEGKLSEDGTSISGTWSQGLPLPLELRRAGGLWCWCLGWGILRTSSISSC